MKRVNVTSIEIIHLDRITDFFDNTREEITSGAVQYAYESDDFHDWLLENLVELLQPDSRYEIKIDLDPEYEQYIEDIQANKFDRRQVVTAMINYAVVEHEDNFKEWWSEQNPLYLSMEESEQIIQDDIMGLGEDEQICSLCGAPEIKADGMCTDCLVERTPS